MWKGAESTMIYRLALADSEHGQLVLLGKNEMVHAVDTIQLTPEADASAAGGARTRVDYKLQVELRSWRHPLIGLIASDLRQLGRDALDGLQQTCADRFGSSEATTGATDAETSSSLRGRHARHGRGSVES